MASSALRCTPLLAGAGWEGGCCFGGTAKTTTCSSSAVAANFQQTAAGAFEKAVLRGGGERQAAAAGGDSAAVLRSRSKSSLFGGSFDSQRHCGCRDVLLSSNFQCGNFSRATQVHAIPANVEMLEAYEMEMKVRDYELDHYGVVNNAIYAQFCQQARTELLEHIGFRPDGVTESGKSMAISDMTMKFLSPLRSGDRYIATSRIAGTTAVRLIFEDHIYKLPERQLVMSAKSTVVVLDHNGRPGRLPDEIKIKLVAGYSTNCQMKLIDGDVNGNINDNLTTDRVNGHSTSSYVNGNSASAHVNGKSTSGHVN